MPYGVPCPTNLPISATSTVSSPSQYVTKCECSFTKNAAGKTLKKFDCSMKGITSLKGMEIWKDAEYFDLSINKVWSGQEVYDLGKLKITRSIIRALTKPGSGHHIWVLTL